MWSEWLVSCDCGFQSVCPLMKKGKRFRDWGGNWVLSWLVGLCSVNFNPIFYWWVWLCSLPVIYLETNYDGGNEDNGDLLQKAPSIHCCTQWPQPCSKPPPTHASTADSWTLMGKSGSVSCVITAPFSWVLMHKVLFVPPRVCFPVLCKFWQLYGGGWWRPPPRGFTPYPGLLHPEPLPLRQASADLYFSIETMITMFCAYLNLVFRICSVKFILIAEQKFLRCLIFIPSYSAIVNLKEIFQYANNSIVLKKNSWVQSIFIIWFILSFQSLYCFFIYE